MDSKERLPVAQWILERNLAWIAAAEVKVGVIVAIDVAMLGAIGAAYSDADPSARTAWANLWAISASALIISGIFCCAMAVLPRLGGPDKSLVFFGKICSVESSEYVELLREKDDAYLLEDLAAQIHRNAEIASEKYSWVKASMYWSFLSIIPWFASISCLIGK